MLKPLPALIAVMILSSCVFAQLPDTLWTRFYHLGDDQGYTVQQTSDGGYILAGYECCWGAGSNDFYLIKIDANGDTLWTHTYGGAVSDIGRAAVQTSDGGYVFTGYTNSFGAGADDVYLIKTNSVGDTLWTRTYGGSGTESGYSVRQTTDGGYIIAGRTNSFGLLSYDFYLVKTDANGDTLWTRHYGGNATDTASKVRQTSDGGYVVLGYTQSYGAGGQDIWLVKTNSTGDTLWTHTYGELSTQSGSSVEQTTDGGYIINGRTNYATHGNYDYYVVKTNSTGDTLWTRKFGGINMELGYNAQQTADGGYMFAGHTESYGAGSSDFYIIRANSTGDTLWTRTFGGSGLDLCNDGQITSDNGYICVGQSNSIGPANDFYAVRLQGEGGGLGLVENLVVAVMGDSISLGWTAVSGATGYKVYSGQSPEPGGMTLLGTTTDLFFVHESIISSSSKTFYVVTATDE